MGLLDWDHNAYYHRLLIRQLPRPCMRVLDVGCGAGAFAAELASRAAHVDALDRSPAMIEAARQRTPANVTCILGDVMRDPLPAESYDAIVSVTALHQLPLGDALRRLSRALRPGGVLAAVALPRRDLPRELPVELLAATGHRVFGAAFAVLRASGRRGWYRLEPSHATMPKVLDPPLTTRQVGQQAAATLPGARARRLVSGATFFSGSDRPGLTTLMPGNAQPDGTTPPRPPLACLTKLQRPATGHTAEATGCRSHTFCCMADAGPGRALASASARQFCRYGLSCGPAPRRERR